ncbi:hypothetical protein AYI68_g67 [Smittium mucronatum]|uniref:LIM zinc-binding domain-containing protein n=1 Tax=Smittium mucronatum TaxID=133383 RepID=A0A1R0H994_9FUNG|nr:hypothetical protein AYI68_g67 [Smittium mucronatum]
MSQFRNNRLSKTRSMVIDSPIQTNVPAKSYFNSNDTNYYSKSPRNSSIDGSRDSGQRINHSPTNSLVFPSMPTYSPVVSTPVFGDTTSFDKLLAHKNITKELMGVLSPSPLLTKSPNLSNYSLFTDSQQSIPKYNKGYPTNSDNTSTPPPTRKNRPTTSREARSQSFSELMDKMKTSDILNSRTPRLTKNTLFDEQALESQQYPSTKPSSRYSAYIPNSHPAHSRSPAVDSIAFEPSHRFSSYIPESLPSPMPEHTLQNNNYIKTPSLISLAHDDRSSPRLYTKNRISYTSTPPNVPQRPTSLKEAAINSPRIDSNYNSSNLKPPQRYSDLSQLSIPKLSTPNAIDPPPVRKPTASPSPYSSPILSSKFNSQQYSSPISSPKINFSGSKKNCSNCSKSLLPEQQKLISNQPDKTFCFDCYTKEYKKGTCFICNKTVLTFGRPWAELNGKVYHKLCLLCSNCNSLINENPTLTAAGAIKCNDCGFSKSYMLGPNPSTDSLPPSFNSNSTSVYNLNRTTHNLPAASTPSLPISPPIKPTTAFAHEIPPVSAPSLSTTSTSSSSKPSTVSSPKISTISIHKNPTASTPNLPIFSSPSFPSAPSSNHPISSTSNHSITSTTSPSNRSSGRLSHRKSGTIAFNFNLEPTSPRVESKPSVVPTSPRSPPKSSYNPNTFLSKTPRKDLLKLVSDTSDTTKIAIPKFNVYKKPDPVPSPKQADEPITNSSISSITKDLDYQMRMDIMDKLYSDMKLLGSHGDHPPKIIPKSNYESDHQLPLSHRPDSQRISATPLSIIVPERNQSIGSTLIQKNTLLNSKSVNNFEYPSDPKPQTPLSDVIDKQPQYARSPLENNIQSSEEPVESNITSSIANPDFYSSPQDENSSPKSDISNNFNSLNINPSSSSNSFDGHTSEKSKLSIKSEICESKVVNPGVAQGEKNDERPNYTSDDLLNDEYVYSSFPNPVVPPSESEALVYRTESPINNHSFLSSVIVDKVSPDSSTDSLPPKSPQNDSNTQTCTSSRDISTDVESFGKDPEFTAKLKSAINELANHDQNLSATSLTENGSTDPIAISDKPTINIENTKESASLSPLSNQNHVHQKLEPKKSQEPLSSTEPSKSLKATRGSLFEHDSQSKTVKDVHNLPISFNSNRALKQAYNSNIPQSLVDLPDLRANTIKKTSTSSFSSNLENKKSNLNPLQTFSASLAFNNPRGSLIGTIRGLRGIEDALNKPTLTDLDSLFGFKVKENSTQKMSSENRRLSSPLSHKGALISRPNPRSGTRKSIEKTVGKAGNHPQLKGSVANIVNKINNFSVLSFNDGSMPSMNIGNDDSIIEDILQDSDTEDDNCAKCNKKIFNGYFTTDDGAKIHSSCFSCGKCNKLIDDGIYISHDGSVFHPICAPELPATVEVQTVPERPHKKPFDFLVPSPRPEASLQKSRDIKVDRNSSIKKRIRDFVNKQNSFSRRESGSLSSVTDEIVYSDVESVDIHDDEVKNDEKLCYRCNSPVEDSVLYISDGKFYHPDCFTCLGCNERFEQGSYVSLNGQTYHRHCAPLVMATDISDSHPQLSSSSPDPSSNSQAHSIEHQDRYCPVCNRLIDGIFIENNGQSFHPDCFRCLDCKNVITTDMCFGEISDGVPCCEPCLNIRFP